MPVRSALQQKFALDWDPTLATMRTKASRKKLAYPTSPATSETAGRSRLATAPGALRTKRIRVSIYCRRDAATNEYLNKIIPSHGALPSGLSWNAAEGPASWSGARGSTDGTNSSISTSSSATYGSWGSGESGIAARRACRICSHTNSAVAFCRGFFRTKSGRAMEPGNR